MCVYFSRMGAGQMNFRQLSQQIELKTGGLSSTPHIVNSHSDFSNFENVSWKKSYYTDPGQIAVHDKSLPKVIINFMFSITILLKFIGNVVFHPFVL